MIKVSFSELETSLGCPKMNSGAILKIVKKLNEIENSKNALEPTGDPE